MRTLAPLALVITGCATQATLPPADAPATLAEAETQFAAQSVREGMRAAFLAWLAPGSTLFRNGPVDGPAEIARNPDPPIVLEWRPVFVEVSASGDVGLSTGPSRVRSTTDPARPERYGQFVSIWKRTTGGEWRVWVDLGISHPGPALWETPLTAAFSPKATGAAEGTIAQAEAEFARLANTAGHCAAYAALASPTLKLYREGSAPWLGREASLASPAIRGSAQWTMDRGETGAAGDFGYAIGRYGPSGGGKEGDFLRVWRRERDGWRIALDVVNEVKPK